MNQVADVCNKRLQEAKPWEAPSSPASRRCSSPWAGRSAAIAVMLWPVMPVFADDAGGRLRPGAAGRLGGRTSTPSSGRRWWRRQAAPDRPARREAGGEARRRARRRGAAGSPRRRAPPRPRPGPPAPRRPPRRAAGLRGHRLRRLRQGGAAGGARPRRGAGAQGRQAPPAHRGRGRAGAAHHRGRDRRGLPGAGGAGRAGASWWWRTSSRARCAGITSQGMLLAAGEPPTSRWSRWTRASAPGDAGQVSLIDSHAHLDFEDFQGDLDGGGGPRRARPAWTASWRSASGGRPGNFGNAARAGRGPGPAVFAATVGIHPHECARVPEADWEQSARLAARPAPWWRWARPASTTTTTSRRGRCSGRASAAPSGSRGGVGKPVVVHVREADADCARDPPRGGACRPAGGVIHCFTGDWAAAADLPRPRAPRLGGRASSPSRPRRPSARRCASSRATGCWWRPTAPSSRPSRSAGSATSRPTWSTSPRRWRSCGGRRRARSREITTENAARLFRLA